MIQIFLRLVKRFAVLIPGIVIAYFAVRHILPFLDHKLRLPDAVGILATYAITAYVLIPALIRVVRILRPTDHLPLYCVTPDGYASDPLNIGIIATRYELIRAMETAGWYVADPHSPRYLVRHILSVVLGWNYPNAPVSTLYLFGRKQDVAFEIPIDTGAGARHHVRFWATTYEGKTPSNIKAIHWHHRRAHIQDANLLWVGAASLDTGFGFIRHNFQLTHMIDPDTNRERELILEQLKAQKLVGKADYVKLGEPYKLINRVFTGRLHADGRMAIAKLKSPAKKP